MDQRTHRVFRLITSEVAAEKLLDFERDFFAMEILGVRGPRPALALAMEYLAGARMLVDARTQTGNVVYTIIHPILFLVRHSLELYVKALLDPAPPTHDLEELLSFVNAELKRHFGQSLEGSWLQVWIHEFHDYDPTSMQFRYVADRDRSEFFPTDHEVNVEVLRQRLDFASVIFYPFQEALRGQQSHRKPEP